MVYAHAHWACAVPWGKKRKNSLDCCGREALGLGACSFCQAVVECVGRFFKIAAEDLR